MGHDTSGLVHVPPVDAPAGAKVLGYTDLKRLDRAMRSARRTARSTSG